MINMQKNICDIQIIGDTTEWSVTAGDHGALAVERLIYFGFSDAGSGYAFRRCNPAFGALFVCAGGTGRVWTGRQWQVMTQGQVYLAPARTPHAYECMPGRRWNVGWFALEEPLGVAPMVCGTEPVLRSAVVAPLMAAMHGFHGEFSSRRSPAYLEAWLAVLRLELDRILERRCLVDHRLERTWAEVAAAPDRTWNLMGLSRLAALSPEQFRHLCQKHFDMSPMARVTLIRMRRACQLLLRSDLRISEIAEAVGYGNQFAFSTAFRRHIKTTPRAYRKQCR